MNDDNPSKLVGRRRTLQLFGLGVASSSLFVLGGCGNKESGSGGTGESKGASAAGTGCNTPIDEQSKTNRRTLQYQEKAVDSTKKCNACSQYVPAQYGDCGGCKVITGPIKPEGGCLAFAPLAAPGSSKG